MFEMLLAIGWILIGFMLRTLVKLTPWAGDDRLADWLEARFERALTKYFDRKEAERRIEAAAREAAEVDVSRAAVGE
jgi:hypothetical protein